MSIGAHASAKHHSGPFVPGSRSSVSLHDLSSNSNDTLDEHLQIVPPCAMVVDRHPQTVLATHRRIRDGGGPLFLQPKHDLDVQRLQPLFVQAVRAVAEADNVDSRGRDQLQGALALDQCAEIMTLVDILVDQAAELLDPCSFRAIQSFSAWKPRVVCNP